jgi:hypothetical protein
LYLSELGKWWMRPVAKIELPNRQRAGPADRLTSGRSPVQTGNQQQQDSQQAKAPPPIRELNPRGSKVEVALAAKDAERRNRGLRYANRQVYRAQRALENVVEAINQAEEMITEIHRVTVTPVKAAVLPLLPEPPTDVLGQRQKTLNGMRAQLNQARYWSSAARNQFEITSAEWMSVISDDLPDHEAIRQSLLAQQERSWLQNQIVNQPSAALQAQVSRIVARASSLRH